MENISNCCVTTAIMLATASDENDGGFIGSNLEAILDKVWTNIMVPILFILGAPANVVNLIVFYKQGFGQRVNIVLFTLAIVDLLYLTAVCMLYGENIFTDFYSPQRYGPVFRALFSINFVGTSGFFYAAVFLYTIVSCERCLCVVLPLRSKTILRTRTTAVVCIVGVLAISAARFVLTARLDMVCSQDDSSSQESCKVVASEFGKKHAFAIRTSDSIVYGFILTLAFPSIVLITTILTSVKLQQAALWRQKAASIINSRELALTKTMMTLSVVFFILVIPAMLQRILPSFVRGFTATGQLRHVFAANRTLMSVCSCLNASINFVVYYTRSSKFRSTLQTICRKEKSGSGGMTTSAMVSTSGNDG